MVAGVMLGNEVGKLGLEKARMLDYCLMIGNNFPSQSVSKAKIKKKDTLTMSPQPSMAASWELISMTSRHLR